MGFFLSAIRRFASWKPGRKRLLRPACRLRDLGSEWLKQVKSVKWEFCGVHLWEIFPHSFYFHPVVTLTWYLLWSPGWTQFWSKSVFRPMPVLLGSFLSLTFVIKYYLPSNATCCNCKPSDFRPRASPTSLSRNCDCVCWTSLCSCYLWWKRNG